MTFIIECLGKIRFYGRKNVKRITKVLISSGNHNLSSRIIVLHPRLLFWEMVFQILWSPPLGDSLEDCPWGGEGTLAYGSRCTLCEKKWSRSKRWALLFPVQEIEGHRSSGGRRTRLLVVLVLLGGPRREMCWISPGKPRSLTSLFCNPWKIGRRKLIPTLFTLSWGTTPQHSSSVVRQRQALWLIFPKSSMLPGS